MTIPGRTTVTAILLGLLCIGIVGCQQPAAPAASSPASSPSKSVPHKASLTLAELKPPVTMPTSRPVTQPAIPPQAAEDVAEGEKLLKNKEFGRAVTRLERAVGFAPQNGRIRRALGLAYAGVGNSGKALENLTIAAAADPDDLRVQLTLGTIYMAQQRPDDAIFALRRALKTTEAKPSNPMTAEAMWRLADLLGICGYWTAADQCYRTLEKWVEQYGRDYMVDHNLKKLVLNPEHLLMRRGALLLKLNKTTDAIAMLDRAYQLDRTDRTVTRLLFRAMAAAGQYARAESLLMELADEPSQKSLVPGLARYVVASLASHRKSTEAMMLMARLVRSDPSHASQLTRAVTELDLSAYEARELTGLFVSDVSRNDPALVPAACYVGGKLLAAHREIASAVTYFDKSIAADKNFLPPYEALIDINLSRHRLNRVAELIQHVRQVGGNTLYGHTIAAKLYLEVGDARQAVAELAGALQADDKYVPALLLLATAYEKLHQTDLAEKALLGAYRLNPEDMDVYRLLILFYLTHHEYDKASQAVQTLLRLDPQNLLGRTMAARVLLASGRIAAGDKFLQSLLKEAPDDPDVQVLAVRSELLKGRNKLGLKEAQQAVRQLGKVIRAHPDNAEAVATLNDVIGAAGHALNPLVVWGDLYRDLPARMPIAVRYAQALAYANRKTQAADILIKLNEERNGDFALQQEIVALLSEDKKYGRVIQLLEKWIGPLTASPDYQEMWFSSQLLQAYLDKKDFASAHALLDRQLAAVAKNPEMVETLQLRKMLIFAREKQYDALVDYAIKLVSKARNKPKLRRFTVGLLLEEKRYDDALKLLDTWVPKLKGEEADALRYMKLYVLQKSGRDAQAEQYAHKWLAAAPDYQPARRALAEVLSNQGKFAELKAVVDQWLADANAPTTAPAIVSDEVRWLWQMQLYALQHLYKYADGLKRVEAYLEIVPRDVDLLREKATFLIEMGRTKEAIGVLELLYALQKGSPAALNNLGYYYAEAGVELEKAEKLIKQALELIPADDDSGIAERERLAYSDSLAWVYYKQGRFAAAARIFSSIITNKIMQDDEESSAVMFDHTGDTFYRLGRKNDAVKQWQRAVELARKAKYLPLELKAIQENGPRKIQAVKAGKEPLVAPLGEGVKIGNAKDNK